MMLGRWLVVKATLAAVKSEAIVAKITAFEGIIAA
jgi:hypothetical protein